MYADFFSYIRSFDIFVLLETHLCQDKIKNFNKYFGGYELFWKPASRDNKYGRGIGGCLLGVKKSLARMNFSYSFQNIEQNTIINIKIKSVEFNLIPLYMRSAAWNDEFNNLEVLLKEYDLINPIVIGDLNIRIGLLQKTIETQNQKPIMAVKQDRNSRDTVVNTKGRHFIQFCYDYGLIILNGRTTGDEEGELTFISRVGESVIDICAMSAEILHYVDNFCVENKIWSDHFPIALSLNIKLDQAKEDNNSNLLPRLHWKDNLKCDYQRHVTNALQQKINSQEREYLQFGEITNIIKDAYGRIYKGARNITQKQKWFTAKCHDARNVSFKKLEIYRANRNDENRKRYIAANKKYKEICQEAKAKYSRKLDELIDKVHDSKDWWKIAKEIRGEETKSTINISAEDFKNYFEQLLNPCQTSLDIQYAYLHTTNFELDRVISVDEINDVLDKAKLNKAPGQDRVPYEFLKNAPPELLHQIAKTCNILYDRGCLDEAFVLSIIYPIYKKGDPEMTNNYRGISFMNCLPKVMMGILNGRLSSWVQNNKILNEYQAGFRKNYSTADNIYNLWSIVHINFSENKKTYAFFVDFKAAFDRVSRKALVYKLHTLGVSSKFVKFIECIYGNTQSAVWSGEHLSKSFSTETGVKQGCLLSPLLFALYLNDLHDCLEGGIQIGNLNIRLLLYADDIVIIADEINILQEMIYKLEKYCRQWNVEVNMSKSEIMVFRKGGRLARNEKWYYNGQEIKIATEYRYLGVTLSPRMVFKKHIEERNAAAKTSINLTWQNFLKKKSISMCSKWKLFMAVCRAVQTYGAQVWGFANFEDVDQLQVYFLKKILRLPNFTPSYVLRLETGIDEGHLFTLDLHMRYLMKTLFDYEEDRLPHYFSKLIVQKQILGISELNKLGAGYGISWTESNLNKREWEQNRKNLLSSLKAKYYNNHLTKVAETSRIYKYLDTTAGFRIFSEEFNQENLTWILKARSDLIKLNGNRFQVNASSICTLCNSQETENIAHFLGRCNALNEFRVRYLKKSFLNETEIIDVLNGTSVNWNYLASYVKRSVEYRNFLITEFNN